MNKHLEDFKQEAVRIARTSGLSRRRVADLGVGLSTLGKWVSQYRPSDLSSAPSADLAKENERLRLENYILKDAGLDVGERHVGRLMGINGISTVRTRKHKT